MGQSREKLRAEDKKCVMSVYMTFKTMRFYEVISGENTEKGMLGQSKIWMLKNILESQRRKLIRSTAWNKEISKKMFKTKRIRSLSGRI